MNPALYFISRAAGWGRKLAWFVAGAAPWLILPARAGVVSSCQTQAQTISCTGALDTSEDVFLETFSLLGNESVDVQTWGFGGGINAAGSAIPSGGFDSLVALFSGPAASAAVLTDGGGNPIASSDASTLFSPGCPPAGLVTVGTVPDNCGDNHLSVSLGPGMYTLLLSDAAFVPLAINPGVPGAFDLTDTTSGNYGSSTGNGAYTDLTGGAFQTCATSTDCNLDTPDFAVDLTSRPDAPVPSPEAAPSELFALAALVALALVAVRKRASWKPRRRNAGYGRPDLSD